MKYYVIEITTLQDNTEIPGIFAHETPQAALSAFHSTLASKLADANVKACYCGVMTSGGAIVRQERFGETEEPIIP